MSFSIIELAAAIVAETSEAPDSLWWKLLKITAIGAVGIGVGMVVEKVLEKGRQTVSALGECFAPTGASSRYRKKTKPSHGVGDINVLVEDMAEKLNQSEQRARALEESLEKSAIEISRLIDDKQILEKQVADLNAKLVFARHLEKVSPELINWMQAVIGYAGNKCLFPADADELAMFRSDAKMLPMLLRNNGIQCDWVPPSEGLGFLHKCDVRVADGKEIVSAPMLLREGVIIAEGIVLVPNVDAAHDADDPQEAKNAVGSGEVAIGMDSESMKGNDSLPLCDTSLNDGVGGDDSVLHDAVVESKDDNSQTDKTGGSSSPSWDFGL